MFDGIEVDMLDVGDADCILVTRWIAGVATYVLIDGGNAGDYEKVRAFLKSRGISYIHALVSTHGHDDHAAGLVKLVNDPSLFFGSVYIHIPQNHVRMEKVQTALRLAAGNREALLIEKTLTTVQDLLSALAARLITPIEPFAGVEIAGFLTVVGPTKEYYKELVQEFEDADAIKTIGQKNLERMMDNFFYSNLLEKGLIEAALLEDPQTTPENNSSVILATICNGAKYLFTSDAGAPALHRARNTYQIDQCNWMQIPHHGSRHNITAALIEQFAPKVAYVSAAGNGDHPRRAVVNAFKEIGASVFSTHYPDGADLYHHRGQVPARVGYVSATPLYDEPDKSKAA
jgi:beta-lactamase superfamily II metal-dependent hydrolase